MIRPVCVKASAHEISGFVYLQMCFTTLILVLPGFMARYELNQTMAILHEKEHFISQVSGEVERGKNTTKTTIDPGCTLFHTLFRLNPNLLTYTHCYC